MTTSRRRTQFGLSAKIMLAMLLLSIVPMILIWYQIAGQLERMHVFLLKDAQSFSVLLEKVTERRSLENHAEKYAEDLTREFEYATIRMLLTMLTLIVAVSLLLIFMARYFSRKLIAPLEKLEMNIRQWDGSTPIGVFVEGDDEIANLASQFSLMTDKVARLRAEAKERQSALESAERDLKAFAQTLEERIDQRTRRLRRALENLRSLDKTKDEFISLITHELKTPLTSISACSEALSGQVDLPRETHEQFVKIIQDESMRLTRLINDVLEYSRISAGKLPIMARRVSLIQLLQRSVLHHRPTSEKRGVHLVFAEPEIPDPRFSDIPLDPDRIEQVMSNLLGNAIKYTKEGGTVTVRIQALKKAVRKFPTWFALISVEDTGIGIEQSMRKKVFERFAQATKMEFHSEGTGLGLPIAKGLINQHGGKLWFTSQFGKGSTFFFTLPLEPFPLQRRDEEPVEDEAVGNKAPGSNKT